MKKHLCRSRDGGKEYFAFSVDRKMAACDSTLLVPKPKRCSAKEIIKQMDKGCVCKACIRIVVVERLNGIRPPEKVKLHVDIGASSDRMYKILANVGVTTKKAGASLASIGEMTA